MVVSLGEFRGNVRNSEVRREVEGTQKSPGRSCEEKTGTPNEMCEAGVSGERGPEDGATTGPGKLRSMGKLQGTGRG